MREVAKLHRGHIPEHAEAYGDNVRTTLERCRAVTDDQFQAPTRLRQEYRERAAEAIEGRRWRCRVARLSTPASVQPVARPGDDARLLAAGALLERALACG